MDNPIELKELVGLFKNHDTVTFTLSGIGEMVLETGMFKNVIEEIENKCKTAIVVEFHEPTYYIGCGNCEAEVVGKYCSECGAKLIYESDCER